MRRWSPDGEVKLQRLVNSSSGMLSWRARVVRTSIAQEWAFLVKDLPSELADVSSDG